MWKPEEEAKEATDAAPVEVEGVQAVLTEDKEGVKVVPAAEGVSDTPAAKEEAKAAEPEVAKPKAEDA